MMELIFIVLCYLSVLTALWAVVTIKDTPAPGMTDEEIKRRVCMAVNKKEEAEL